MSDVEQQPSEGPPEVSPESDSVGPAVMHSAEPGRVCEVALDNFEGPLDLLLHLVRRHELDILDIPIAFVCEKYLEYIEFMQALDLEVAGDYLVMAATLAYLKSRELVPQQVEEVEEGELEEGPDPREQLIVRLLEYQKFKDAAARLDQRPMAGRDTFGRGQDVELPPLDAGLAPITLFRLAEAYTRVLERARIHKSHEVVMETISVAARMDQLATVLLDRSRFDFEGLFLERSWSSEAELRSMLVVTLMSILELVRMGVATVHQPPGTYAIVVERVADAQETREALRDYDESLSFGDGKSNEEAAAEGDAEPAVEGAAEAEEAVAEVSAEAGVWTDEGAADEVPVDEVPADEVPADEVPADEVPVEPVEGLTEEVSAESVEPPAEVEVPIVSAEPPGAAMEAEVPTESVEPPVAAVEAEVSTDPVEPPVAAVEAEVFTESEALWEAPGEVESPDPVTDVVSGAAQVTEPSAPGPDLEPEGGSEDSAVRADGEGAGASGQSVVSESPSVAATVAEPLVPEPAPADGASETAEVDEDGENGEAQALEGS